MDIQIRRMTDADIEEVTALEQACQPHPWSSELFRRELQSRIARIDLALSEGRIVGYLNSWLVAGEIEIHNLVTDPAFRRRGVARKLVGNLFRETAGMQRAFLEVRAGNLPAINLYLALGFRQVDCRAGYYHDGEDALIMVRERSFDLV